MLELRLVRSDKSIKDPFGPAFLRSWPLPTKWSVCECRLPLVIRLVTALLMFTALLANSSVFNSVQATHPWNSQLIDMSVYAAKHGSSKKELHS